MLPVLFSVALMEQSQFNYLVLQDSSMENPGKEVSIWGAVSCKACED